MKVFVVVSSIPYESTHQFRGVFSSREKAQAAIDSFADPDWDMDFVHWEIFEEDVQ